MAIFGEGEQLLGEIEKEARAHPQQAQKILSEAEQLAEKETGGKYDTQIQGAGTKIEQEVEGQQPPASQAAGRALVAPLATVWANEQSAQASSAGL